MKNLLFILLAAMTVATSCTKETATDFPYNEQATAQMVAHTNERSAAEPADISYSFSGRGMIVAKQLQETYEGVTYDFLSLQYTGSRLGKEDQSYAFDIDLGFGEVKFPGFIANAYISFLGNQLIIRDMNSDFTINFFVQETEDSQNLAPKLQPEVVSGIRIVHEDEGFNKRASGCSCFCQNLPNSGPVPSSKRSCDCKSKCENSCSASCHGARQIARCDDLCPQE